MKRMGEKGPQSFACLDGLLSPLPTPCLCQSFSAAGAGSGIGSSAQQRSQAAKQQGLPGSRSTTCMQQLADINGYHSLRALLLQWK